MWQIYGLFMKKRFLKKLISSQMRRGVRKRICILEKSAGRHVWLQGFWRMKQSAGADTETVR